MIAQAPVRADFRWQEECIHYSICTLVTKLAQYEEMVTSFRDQGFREPDCEFLYIDNIEANTFDAYSGINLFLNVARGQYVILCHQDILLLEDGRVNLDAALAKLTQLDSSWAACGNAGGDHHGRLVLRLTDPHGTDQRVGDFPAKVRSLDENFIVVRRSANLALSHDLEGYHFYGTDICIIADVLGSSCYVIDFHLRHKSKGVTDSAFFIARELLTRKYRHAFRSRVITTTCTRLFVTGLPFLGQLLDTVALGSDIVTRVGGLVGRNAARLRRALFRT
jgi:hypothetical protein